MTAEREAMTLENVRDRLRIMADVYSEHAFADNLLSLASDIDAHLSRAAEPVVWALAWPPDIRRGRVNEMTVFDSLRDANEYADKAARPDALNPNPVRPAVVPLYTHPPEPADAATKALAALGHVRKPNDRCTARYAEVPKEDRPPGPANVPVWCCLRAGHDGPHKCSHFGMHVPFVMRSDQTVMGDPLPDVCSKCGTRWPCPDAASVIAAMAQESGDGR